MAKQPTSIRDLLNARKAELASVLAAHDVMWKEKSEQLQALQQQHQAIQQQMQKDGAQNQLKITHLEGMIAAYESQLPKKKKK